MVIVLLHRSDVMVGYILWALTCSHAAWWVLSVPFYLEIMLVKLQVKRKNKNIPELEMHPRL